MDSMQAVVIKEYGGLDSMTMGQYSVPELEEEEVLIKVKAFGLNRADILQRMGKYPAPKGSSPLLGLEVSGEVASCGAKVTAVKVGDKVAALLSSGGYAEYAAGHQDHLLTVPSNMSFEEAAAIPEVFITAYQALCQIGKLREEEQVMIHAAASGVGTAAIQIAKWKGAKIIATASKSKHQACSQLGADHCIDYKTEDFSKKVLELTNSKGVDLIIDFIGASYFQKNLNSLKLDGRLVMLGFLGGVKVPDLNIINLLAKRAQVTGTTLRSRSLEYKSNLVKAFKKDIYPAILNKEINPVIHQVMPWHSFKQAHEMMENNENIGKIILKIDS